MEVTSTEAFVTSTEAFMEETVTEAFTKASVGVPSTEGFVTSTAIDAKGGIRDERFVLLVSFPFSHCRMWPLLRMLWCIVVSCGYEALQGVRRGGAGGVRKSSS